MRFVYNCIKMPIIFLLYSRIRIPTHRMNDTFFLIDNYGFSLKSGIIHQVFLCMCTHSAAKQHSEK